MRKAKQVLSYVSESAASTPGKWIFPSIDTLESLGQMWVLKYNIRVPLTWLRGWNEYMIYKEKMRQPGLSAWFQGTLSTVCLMRGYTEYRPKFFFS